MINYSSPHTRLAAKLMPWVCTLVFTCFSFCYLYLYQSEYLAQLQYHLSRGETTYQPLVGAVLITLSLLLLGLFIHRTVRLPVRFCALSWFPSVFLLTALTALRLSELPGFATGIPWLGMLCSLVVFAFAVCFCCLHPDATDERSSFSSCLSCNLFLLCCMLFMTGSMGYSSTSGHRELRMGHLLHQHRYAEAVQCCTDTAEVTHRLFALRAAALAFSGILGEDLFRYPVPLGTHAIMPDQSDSAFVYNALPRMYRAMRAVPRCAARFDERTFLERALQTDSLPRPFALDYLLCSHLLRGELSLFCRTFVLHADSLDASLPRHYREALALCQSRGLLPVASLPAAESGFAKSSVRQVPAESACSLPYVDSDMEENLNRFLRLHSMASLGNESAADSLAEYSGTYWDYFASRFQ